MALYLDGQKIISSGGGSGGHTIVDNEGVSLEQRTNLQFNGAYSEDNSTDDTTEVNVVREMTKAEFDELTEEEKTGLINITDITSGNDDRFQPVIYSTEEREIGVWTDGKPLYEKTIDIAQYSVTAEDTQFTNLVAIANIDFLVSADVNKQPPNVGQLLRFTSSNGYIQVASKTTINISAFGNLPVTFCYTKTTDAAGSGQWTPQGVPSHHYSEDEQVVGTWIDGKTIYEKTIVLPTSISVAGNTWTDIDNSDWSIVDTFVGGFMINANGAVVGFVAFDKNTNNNKLRVLQTRNADITCKTITVQYTKSST